MTALPGTDPSSPIIADAHNTVVSQESSDMAATPVTTFQEEDGNMAAASNFSQQSQVRPAEET